MDKTILRLVAGLIYILFLIIQIGNPVETIQSYIERDFIKVNMDSEILFVLFLLLYATIELASQHIIYLSLTTRYINTYIYNPNKVNINLPIRILIGIFAILSIILLLYLDIEYQEKKYPDKQNAINIYASIMQENNFYEILTDKEIFKAFLYSESTIPYVFLGSAVSDRNPTFIVFLLILLYSTLTNDYKPLLSRKIFAIPLMLYIGLCPSYILYGIRELNLSTEELITSILAIFVSVAKLTIVYIIIIKLLEYSMDMRERKDEVS